MFFDLIFRNSKRSRKENGLFFSTLLVSIIAFYIILSLPHQDVMLFLKKMESDAVNKLLALIPVFFCMTLVILFFLIYFASKYQLERRQHEFGVYLIMGMRRGKLFFMLLAEDVYNSILALLIGVPAAILLSELISLITARAIGMGIIGHQFSFSGYAVLVTMAGFLSSKLFAFIILSGKISRQEIGSLLVGTPEGTKEQKPAWVYISALAVGIVCLCSAYMLAICGFSWRTIKEMGITLVLGLVGTILFFYGLRMFLVIVLKASKQDRALWNFTFRQLQEQVIHRSNTMAISSILILAGLCCFGSGISFTQMYGGSERHVLDYTFQNYDFEDSEEGAEYIQKTLKEKKLDRMFSNIIEMKVGNIRTTEKVKNVFVMDSVMNALSELPDSEDRDVLLNNLGYTDLPYLISLSGYNQLLEAAGMPVLQLKSDEAAVYMDTTFTTPKRTEILNHILSANPEIQLDGIPLHLTGTVQSVDLVTDRSITLSFALILPDDVFAFYTQGQYDVYVDAILKNEVTNGVGLMSAISDMNEKLNATGLSYESYLQNMGRKLFYIVAASYLTIYLAVIFLIVANTVIGVQFLMDQQKTSRRYKTLIRLGASYDSLCQSAKTQINWHFGIPTVVAAISSLFATRALIPVLLSSGAEGNLGELLLIAGAMIFVLCMIECLYLVAVKRSSSRYLLTLMVPEREE